MEPSLPPKALIRLQNAFVDGNEQRPSVEGSNPACSSAESANHRNGARKAGDGQPYPALAALHQMAELARQPSTGHRIQPNSHRPSCLNTAITSPRRGFTVFGVPGL